MNEVPPNQFRASSRSQMTYSILGLPKDSSTLFEEDAQILQGGGRPLQAVSYLGLYASNQNNMELDVGSEALQQHSYNQNASSLSSTAYPTACHIKVPPGNDGCHRTTSEQVAEAK